MAKVGKSFVKDVYLFEKDQCSVPRVKTEMYEQRRIVNSVTFKQQASESHVVQLIHDIFPHAFDPLRDNQQFE